MDSAPYVVRRANIDDLEGLKLFWDRNHQQILDLEKRLTEFQLAASAEGDLLGAMALRVVSKQGVIHSEAYLDDDQGADLRPLLWERVGNVARNLGLVRVWIDARTESSAYWEERGFQRPASDLLAQLPKDADPPKGEWMVLPLRKESAELVSIEKEFEIFQMAQRADSERVIAQAHKLKAVAVAVVIVVVLMAMVGGILTFLKVKSSGLP